MAATVHFITFGLLALGATARVIWTGNELEISNSYTDRQQYLQRRDNTVSCPASLPSNFSCPSDTVCLALNTTASIQAALCCPAGQDCRTIQPISCNLSSQNATAAPSSSLHVNPPTQLQSCGTACCPPGYSCQNGNCAAQSASASSSSVAPAATSTGNAVQPVTTLAPSATGLNTPIPSSGSGDTGSTTSHEFSGSSFAIGFVPGIVLGSLLAACLIFLILRRRRTNDSSFNEKQSPRDTLTDLGTLSRRPTMHGRSISEPTPDPATGFRSDFLRSTPPRGVLDGADANNGYHVEITGPTDAPTTPARTPKAVRALFSRSPFLSQAPSTPPSTQMPLPAHLKRGTLSFTVSPIRALKKQKSMHSLRRQMTDASHGSSSRRTRPDLTRSGSTETIQVLMPSNEPYTPDQRPQASSSQIPSTASTSTYGQHDSPEPGVQSHDLAPAQYASSSRYPTLLYTPPQQQVPAGSGSAEQNNPAGLGTPYTPSRYNSNGRGRFTDSISEEPEGLFVPRQGERRDTTFSAMMERAGLRRSDLVFGIGERR